MLILHYGHDLNVTLDNNSIIILQLAYKINRIVVPKMESKVTEHQECCWD